MTPTPSPAWQPDDLEAIRCALSIPVQLQALEAIAAAMAGLLQTHPGAISSAQAELAAISLIDQQLPDLTPSSCRRRSRCAAMPLSLGPSAPMGNCR